MKRFIKDDGREKPVRYCRKDRGGCGATLPPTRYFLCTECISSLPDEDYLSEMMGETLELAASDANQVQRERQPIVIPTGERQCLDCKTMKSYTEFPMMRRAGWVGPRTRCRPCFRTKAKARDRSRRAAFKQPQPEIEQ